MHAFQIFSPSLECRESLGTWNLNTVTRALSLVSNSLLFLLSVFIFSRCGDRLSGHNIALLNNIRAHRLGTWLAKLSPGLTRDILTLQLQIWSYLFLQSCLKHVGWVYSFHVSQRLCSFWCKQTASHSWANAILSNPIFLSSLSSEPYKMELHHALDVAKPFFNECICVHMHVAVRGQH